MKDRSERLETIRRIISATHIESQDELKRQLELAGFSVTQATLSRDLKYIQVGKVADGDGGYHYALQEGGTDYVRDMIRGWISMEFSGNVGVVKTLPGHANSVAIAIDAFEFEELLGTVAGDDTIMLVLKKGVKSEALVRSLTETVPGITAGESGE